MKAGIVSLLIVCLCLGCAGPKITGEVPKDYYTIQIMIEKAKTLEPDDEGWRTLAIPDKDFDINFMEFIVFVKDKSWGLGFVKHGLGGRTGVIEYDASNGKWFIVIDETLPTELSPEDAQQQIREFWRIIMEYGNFDKMRRFTILIPIQPQGV